MAHAARHKSTPRCGSGPKLRLEGAPPPFCALGPHTSPPPSQSIETRASGVGAKGGWVGREGLGLREGSSSCNGGKGDTTRIQGGFPPKGSLGQTHIWGLDLCEHACLKRVLAYVRAKIAHPKVADPTPHGSKPFL